MKCTFYIIAKEDNKNIGFYLVAFFCNGMVVLSFLCALSFSKYVHIIYRYTVTHMLNAMIFFYSILFLIFSFADEI